MEKLSLFDILFKDDEQNSGEAAIGSGFFSRQFSGSITKKLKRLLSTRPFRFIDAVADVISHLSTVAYGTILLSFGLVCTLMYFLRLSADGRLVTPIIGAIISLVSIPLLLVDKPLPIFLADFSVTDYIFYEIFCMKRHTTEAAVRLPMLLSAVIGFCLAVVSAFLPLWQIVLFVGIAVCVYAGIESPEFVFLVSLFALPYVRFIPNEDIKYKISL